MILIKNKMVNLRAKFDSFKNRKRLKRKNTTIKTIYTVIRPC